ncbi:MAG: hypothetical protein RIQ60_3156 [Pseudomonadota bacterium]|jgi:hypothetical protein
MQLNPAACDRPTSLVAALSQTAAERPRSPLRLALAAASGALLAAAGQPAAAQPAAAPPSPITGVGAVSWQVDASVLSYSEANGRVKAIEPVVNLRRSDADDRVSSLRLSLDTLTGASPTGAVPQPGVQTVTSASGRTVTTTRAGQVPLDSGFKDLRGAGNFSHELPFGDGRRLSMGLNLSGETDFYSASSNVGLSQEFNNKNTTASVGLALEVDLIKPVGYTPRPLLPHTATYAEGGPAVVGGHDDDASSGVTKTRTVGDLLFGVTQVMSRQWLMQFNLGPGWGSGYHSDPYKVLSVVNGSGVSAGLQTGDLLVSEARPSQRRRLSVYWQNKLMLGGAHVVDLALRHYRDSWGVKANTFDLHYRHDLGGGWYVEPQLRLYRQGAANFYRPYLVEGVDYNSTSHTALLTAASADPRLAALGARTLGLKIGLDLGKGRELGLRVASYQQKQDAIHNAPGYLASVPLADNLRAVLLQAGLSQQF